MNNGCHFPPFRNLKVEPVMPPSYIVEADHKDDWARTITVRVGSSQTDDSGCKVTTGIEDFVVHETIIRRHSPYFETALNEPIFKEAQEHHVPLSYHDPESFRLYLGWIYSHEINISSLDNKDTAEIVGSSLIRAYVLGDFLLDGDFKDAIVDAISDIQAKSCGYLRACLPLAYANTAEKSPIRRIIIDRMAYARNCSPSSFVERERADGILDRETLLDLMEAILLYSEQESAPYQIIRVGHTRGAECSHSKSTERLVTLPSHKPDAFRLYLQWMYTHRITIKFDDDPPYDELIDGYVLGDYLEDGDFRDAITDVILELVVRGTFLFSSIPHLYKNTSEKALLRRAFVDVLVYHTEPTSWISRAREKRELTEDALYDIMENLMDPKHKDTVPLIPLALSPNPCPYHEHANGVCYRITYGQKLGVAN
ncbi:hypothetical protein FKW77_005371 [Venturia effusa]|uniref:BTB domain-containing protein n=1 Tax=Venturia effusa TaxID=50376 RepID=A0A517LK85_9PEZI|nr:hypothetical protein FKW77_005371 [Venturia effusa]